MKKLIKILVVPAMCVLLAGCPEKEEEPINHGRIIEKTHYLAGETRECKDALLPRDKPCELGDPVAFPERCTFLIEEWETRRRQEIEVGCDQAFNDAVLGQSWSRPTPKK